MADCGNREIQQACDQLKALATWITEAEQLLDDITDQCETSPSTVYRAASPPLRQQLNQAVFTEIRIGREPDELSYDLA